MDNLDFSEEEIQEQLVLLGYKNIPRHRLHEFKRDLAELIRHADWESLSSPDPIKSTNSPTAATSHPSPPAFTKEKVSHCHFRSFGEGFFLHDRPVLTPCQNTGHERQQGPSDSYARHTVAPRPRPPPPPAPPPPQPCGAPSMHWGEAHPEETLLTDSCASSTPDTQGRRLIKRKVLRKHQGQSLVCDESVYSDDSDAASLLEERLGDLRLSESAQPDSDTHSQDTLSSETDSLSVSAYESYVRGMTRSHSDGDIRPKPKSFIRPVMNQPTIKKTDPVAKYFQYKQLWEMFKLPGETDRRSLRLEIKERLAYQPPPPKPRKVFVPNSYVVPTEKKRSSLRWEIRNDLANGVLPHRFNYRY